MATYDTLSGRHSHGAAAYEAGSAAGEVQASPHLSQDEKPRAGESPGAAHIGERPDIVELADANGEEAPEVEDAGGANAVGAVSDDAHPLTLDLMLHPSGWRIWPAVALLRWVLQGTDQSQGGLTYRSKPSLGFSGSEIADVVFASDRINLVLTAPGLAAPGSPLPLSDVARIVADMPPRGRGALAAWLDGPGDRFMQAVEDAQRRNNAAFALATGGYIEALRLVSELAGRSAPLVARRGGDLQAAWTGGATNATGLAGVFFGPASAAGLEALIGAFTNLVVRVVEFAGGEIPIQRPATLGGGFGRALGRSCELAAAAIEVVIDGGDEIGALDWARQARRRHSLALLCRAYIGSVSPNFRMFLTLDAHIVPPAVLGGLTTFGGLAVLGRPLQRVRLPMAY